MTGSLTTTTRKNTASRATIDPAKTARGAIRSSVSPHAPILLHRPRGGVARTIVETTPAQHASLPVPGPSRKAARDRASTTSDGAEKTGKRREAVATDAARDALATPVARRRAPAAKIDPPKRPRATASRDAAATQAVARDAGPRAHAAASSCARTRALGRIDAALGSLLDSDQGIAPGMREKVCALAADRIIAASAPAFDAVRAEIGRFASTLDAGRRRMLEDVALAARPSPDAVLADCAASIPVVELLTLCLTDRGPDATRPGAPRIVRSNHVVAASSYGEPGAVAWWNRAGADGETGGIGDTEAPSVSQTGASAVLERLHRRAYALAAVDPALREALLDQSDHSLRAGKLRTVAVAHLLAAMRAAGAIPADDLEALAARLRGEVARAPAAPRPGLVDVAAMLGAEVASATIARRAALAGLNI